MSAAIMFSDLMGANSRPKPHKPADKYMGEMLWEFLAEERYAETTGKHWDYLPNTWKRKWMEHEKEVSNGKASSAA